MENDNATVSKKIKLKKFFMIMWSAIAALLAIFVIISVVLYSEYKKGQEFAVASMLLVSDEYDETDSYEDLVEEMYDDMHPIDYPESILGSQAEELNRQRQTAADRLDRSLGDLLSEAGYNCYYGSDYLEYIGYIEYSSNNSAIILFAIWAVVALLAISISLFCIVDSKKQLIIEDSKIICMNGKKIKKEFFVKDVKSVSASPLKGLKIIGTGIKHQINLLANANEIKTAIMKQIADGSVENNVPNAPELLNLENLKEYKGLLDSGVITQEEFDAKKQQLLNL